MSFKGLKLKVTKFGHLRRKGFRMPVVKLGDSGLKGLTYVTPQGAKIVYTYSMKQPYLYYFETIKMTTQAVSLFVWRGEYSL